MSFRAVVSRLVIPNLWVRVSTKGRKTKLMGHKMMNWIERQKKHISAALNSFRPPNPFFLKGL